MADYDLAFPAVKYKEGSAKYGWYANAKDDHGGETLCGITRKNFPDWPGWGCLDSYKGKPGWPRNWENDQVLWAMIQKFYRLNFWAPIYNQIIDQDKANRILVLVINTGTHEGHILIQRAIGLTGGAVDGIFGSGTLFKVNACSLLDFNTGLNAAAGAFYDKLAEKDPTQEKFEMSWHERLV